MQDHCRRRMAEGLQFRRLEGDTRIGEVWTTLRVLYGQERDLEVRRKSSSIRQLQPSLQISLGLTMALEPPVSCENPPPSGLASRRPGCKEAGHHRDTQVAVVTWAVQGDRTIGIRLRYRRPSRVGCFTRSFGLLGS